MPERSKPLDLSAVCYDIARTTSWEMNDPQATSLDAIAVKAESFKKIALRELEAFASIGLTEADLTAAVEYLSIHAVPPMGDDIQWFGNMLDVLVGLMVPNVEFSANDPSVQFLKILRNRIDATIKEASA